MKLFLLASAAAFLSTATLAMPRVYQCVVFDYVSDEVVETDFQYIVGSGFFQFKTAYSNVMLYSARQEAVFSISLRSLQNEASYSRREDYGTPLQFAITHGINDYAATVRCRM